MIKYNKITETIQKKLQKIVGENFVITGKNISAEYAVDASIKDGSLYYPEAVVLPKTAQEIAEIFKLANEFLLPVTPRGGGSGLAGGAVALYGGILLDLSRMNQIILIDKIAQYMIVEPAVKTVDLQQAAYQVGFLYAGDPCSNDQCVIGGNIATNAGGNRAVKYGVTSDQVYELEIVTPLGEIVTIGGRLKKNSTGYNLTRLIAGSEGTLGIITKATIKLQPLAPFQTSYVAATDGLHGVIALVGELLANKQIDPISLEVIDRHTIAAIEDYEGRPVFGSPDGDCLMIQFDAESAKAFSEKKDLVAKIAQENQCFFLQEFDGDEIWAARRIWGKAISKKNSIGFSEDLVVPVDQITAFFSIVETLTKKWGFLFRLAGHAGDGNMHLRLLPPIEQEEKIWQESLEELRRELYAATYSLGGRLSGEHGIGFKRKRFLKELASSSELELMKRIKQSFDPNHILNPGKIFDIDAVG